jgi:hypothetical protein
VRPRILASGAQAWKGRLTSTKDQEKLPKNMASGSTEREPITSRESPHRGAYGTRSRLAPVMSVTRVPYPGDRSDDRRILTPRTRTREGEGDMGFRYVIAMIVR